MAKHKNAAKGRADTQKGTSLTPSSHGVTQAIQSRIWWKRWHQWRKYYHRFALLPRCPLDSCNQADCHQNNLYCLSTNKSTQHLKTKYGLCPHQSNFRGGGRWPTPTFPYMEWFVDCWHVQGWPWRMYYQAVVLASGEAILFFGWQSLKEKLPFGNTRDAEFSLTDPVNWARRAVQVELTVNTVHGGHWAIVDAVMEKKTKAREPGCPWGTVKAT